MINDVDYLTITKLDVLDKLDEIKICTGYQYKGEVLSEFPANNEILDQTEPVYESMLGWNQPLSEIRTFDDLPIEAVKYLKRLEEITETPIGIVSVGPKRCQTIWM